MASGLTADETQQVWETTKGLKLCTIPGPRRVQDVASYIRMLGVPEFRPPTEMSSCQGPRFATRARIKEFTREDKETLVLFASQATSPPTAPSTARVPQRSPRSLCPLSRFLSFRHPIADASVGKDICYDATTLLLSTIESVAVVEDRKLSVDRAALREELSATAGFQGLLGTLTCDYFGDYGTERVDIYHHTDSSVTDPAQLPVVYQFAP